MPQSANLRFCGTDPLLKNPKLQGASPKRKLWFGAAIWFGDDAHIKNLRPTFSRAGSDVQTLHAADGCTCKGHKWNDVQPMLKHLQGQGITWPYGLWVISSAAAHQLLLAVVLAVIELISGTLNYVSGGLSQGRP